MVKTLHAARRAAYLVSNPKKKWGLNYSRYAFRQIVKKISKYGIMKCRHIQYEGKCERLQRKYKYDDLDEALISEIKEKRAGGETLDAIADWLGVTYRTLNNWRGKNEDLDKALTEAESMSNQHLALTATAALIKKLQSRVVTEIKKTVTKDADGVVIKTQTTETHKELEPSDALVMFALQRIKPEVWDSLAVKRLDMGADDKTDYGDLINSILRKAQENRHEVQG